MIDIEGSAFTFSIALAGILLFASGIFGRDRADKYILKSFGAAIFIICLFTIALGQESIRSWTNFGLGGLLFALILIGGIPGIRLVKRGRREVINAIVLVGCMAFFLFVLYLWTKL